MFLYFWQNIRCEKIGGIKKINALKKNTRDEKRTNAKKSEKN
jgi:hypothetical protein